MKTAFEIDVPKTIVLIGMMGVGKTSIGRRLSKRLGLTFTDSDNEVEVAAQCSVAEIFDIYGEAAFRDVEQRVVRRLLTGSPHVLATGGSAFANESTRKIIKDYGVSVWLMADVETLLPRIERRDHRPQFSEGDPKETLGKLIETYTPSYSLADLHIDCNGTTPDAIVDKIVLELNRYMSRQQADNGQTIQHA